MTIIALLFSLIFPACPTEDSTFCYWDGGANQKGSQVINFEEGVWINF